MIGPSCQRRLLRPYPREPSGSVTEREDRLATAVLTGPHHELLVGLAATCHAGRHERGPYCVDGPQFDWIADTGLPSIGEAERVAGTGAADAAHPVVRSVMDSLDAGDVRVVLGKVGEVEA